MFLCDISSDNVDIYMKYRRYNQFKSLIFFSMLNQNLQKTEDIWDKWICDEEFLKYLDSILSYHIEGQGPRFNIIIEGLPEELQALLRIKPDVVNAFKMYLNDPKLDKLCKE